MRLPWAQQAFNPIGQQSVQLRPSNRIEVTLLRNFSQLPDQTLRVTPVEVGDEVHWLDPAGFPLASCSKPESWQEKYLDQFDFKLDPNLQLVTSTFYLD